MHARLRAEPGLHVEWFLNLTLSQMKLVWKNECWNLVLLFVTNPEKRQIDAYTILICLYAYQCCVRKGVLACLCMHACMCNVIVNWNTVSNTYNTIEKRRHYSQQRCANPPNLKTVNRKTKNYWVLACPTSVRVVLQYIVCFVWVHGLGNMGASWSFSWGLAVIAKVMQAERQKSDFTEGQEVQRGSTPVTGDIRCPPP
jgi:hypothetical protein